MIKNIKTALVFSLLLVFSLCATVFAGTIGRDYNAFAQDLQAIKTTETATDCGGGNYTENSQNYEVLPANPDESEKSVCGFKPSRREKNGKFDGSEIQFRVAGKVGGRRGISEVLVVGDKVKNGEYVENIRIIVRDLCARKGKNSDSEESKNSETITIVPETNYGYSPEIALVNFTENDGNEIFYTANSGGSGAFAFSYVFAIKEGVAETIFDYSTFPNDYSAEFKDFYKVAVKNNASGAVYSIDISGRGEEYLGGIYNENGTLKAPLTAEVSEVNTVLPFFRGENGTYGLLILRRITGLYSADSFGYVQNFYEYQGGGFNGYYEGVLINPD